MLLVDADERTRQLSQLSRDGRHFDVIGVSHDGEECPAVSVGRSPTPQPRPEPPTLGTVLQIGPERNGHHPAGFFRSTAFGKLISFSGQPADLVLIDTPALLDVSEAVTIADHADAILLVVNRGTSLADLRRARERLAFTDTPADRLPAQPRIRAACLRRASAPRHTGPAQGEGMAGIRIAAVMAVDNRWVLTLSILQRTGVRCTASGVR